MKRYNEMQEIKREFFALRNGVVADALRRGGAPYKIIFGLTLPQLREIADAVGKRPDLARKLWENRTTRESAMLAPMIMERDTLASADEALIMALESPSPEVSDILCRFLFREEPYAEELAFALADNADPLARYTALRLMLNLMILRRLADVSRAVAFAEKEAGGEGITRMVAMQLVEESQY